MTVGSDESGGVYERVTSKGPDSEVWMLKLRFASRPLRTLRGLSSEHPRRLTFGVSWTVILYPDGESSNSTTFPIASLTSVRMYLHNPTVSSESGYVNVTA